MSTKDVVQASADLRKLIIKSGMEAQPERVIRAAMMDNATAIRAALLPFDPSAGWLPIASVPRDESMVFVDAPDMDCGVTIAYYKRTGGAHLGLNGKPFMPHAAQPTHWQPLPAPPEERK